MLFTLLHNQPQHTRMAFAPAIAGTKVGVVLLVQVDAGVEPEGEKCDATGSGRPSDRLWYRLEPNHHLSGHTPIRGISGLYAPRG